MTTAPITITCAEIRQHCPEDYDAHLAVITASLGRPPADDEPIQLRFIDVRTVETGPMLRLLRCCWDRGGRLVATRVHAHEALRQCTHLDDRDAARVRDNICIALGVAVGDLDPDPEALRRARILADLAEGVLAIRQDQLQKAYLEGGTGMDKLQALEAENAAARKFRAFRASALCLEIAQSPVWIDAVEDVRWYWTSVRGTVSNVLSVATTNPRVSS